MAIHGKKKKRYLARLLFSVVLGVCLGFCPSLEAQVAHLVPGAGSNDFPLNAVILVTFDIDIKPSSINGTTFFLNDDFDAVPTYNAAYRTATLTPQRNLDPSTIYTCTLTTDVRNTADGQVFAIDYTWSFTTGTSPDTTALKVLSVTPTDGAEDVSETPQITAVFNGNIQPVTLDTNSFYVNNGIKGNISYDPGKKKATFSLNSGLDSDKTYTATVTTAVKDNSGNTLASDYSWNFTTEDEGGCFIKIVD